MKIWMSQTKRKCPVILQFPLKHTCYTMLFVKISQTEFARKKWLTKLAVERNKFKKHAKFLWGYNRTMWGFPVNNTCWHECIVQKMSHIFWPLHSLVTHFAVAFFCWTILMKFMRISPLHPHVLAKVRTYSADS